MNLHKKFQPARISIRFLRIQEGFGVKRNARSLRIYKEIRLYTLCFILGTHIYEDIMKESN
jgi:hypothetical protein